MAVEKVVTWTTSLNVSSCKVMSASRISSFSAANLRHGMLACESFKHIKRFCSCQRFHRIVYENLRRVTMSASAAAISSPAAVESVATSASAACFRLKRVETNLARSDTARIWVFQGERQEILPSKSKQLNQTSRSSSGW